MIDTADLFYPLTTKCTIRDRLIEYTQDAGSFDKGPKQGFLTAELPKEPLLQDPTLAQLLEITSAKHILIFKMEPWTCYRWHQDHIRGCAVNMLISGSDSHTFLGKRVSNQVYEYRELVYEPDRLYLFNTACEHTIFNRGNHRYMFSVSVTLRRTYRDLLAQFREAGLVR